MLNIVIPMAGAGSRFKSAGYPLPKPLIDVHGLPMIAAVVKNLTPSVYHKFIFICQKDHEADYQIVSVLKSLVPSCEIILIDGMTGGAAETVLKAVSTIDNLNPLMIANSDQLIDFSIDFFLEKAEEADCDGFIMCMTSQSPKWSYLQFDDRNQITAVVEKEVVSTEATVGIYNFKHGRDFVENASEMISLRKKVNNEYYVAPVYTQLISRGGRVGFFNVGEEYKSMIGLGIPEDLENFLAKPASNYIRSIFE